MALKLGSWWRFVKLSRWECYISPGSESRQWGGVNRAVKAPLCPTVTVFYLASVGQQLLFLYDLALLAFEWTIGGYRLHCDKYPYKPQQKYVLFHNIRHLPQQRLQIVTFALALDQRKDKRVLYPNHTLVHYSLHRGSVGLGELYNAVLCTSWCTESEGKSKGNLKLTFLRTPAHVKWRHSVA